MVLFDPQTTKSHGGSDRGISVEGRPCQPQAATAPVSFGDWKGLVAVAAYAPLLLWGPLLGAVTISYWRRRRRG